MILGTAAYMSPEQAGPVRRQARVYLGLRLRALRNADRPPCRFHGETVTDTLAQILEREPNWNALPPRTPSKVLALVRTCLQKDLNRRFNTVAEIRNEMQAAGRDQSSQLVESTMGDCGCGVAAGCSGRDGLVCPGSIANPVGQRAGCARDRPTGRAGAIRRSVSPG